MDGIANIARELGGAIGRDLCYKSTKGILEVLERDVRLYASTKENMSHLETLMYSSMVLNGVIMVIATNLARQSGSSEEKSIEFVKSLVMPCD